MKYVSYLIFLVLISCGQYDESVVRFQAEDSKPFNVLISRINSKDIDPKVGLKGFNWKDGRNRVEYVLFIGGFFAEDSIEIHYESGAKYFVRIKLLESFKCGEIKFHLKCAKASMSLVRSTDDGEEVVSTKFLALKELPML